MNTQKKLTEPMEILEWIREHWSSLKKEDKLKTAIDKYLAISGDEATLTVDDVIQIEEDANISGQHLK